MSMVSGEEPSFDVEAERSAEIGPGTRLGRYRLIRSIARGGMGEVWLARAASTGDERGRLAAIKVLHPHLSDRATFVSMFHDEARIAATLRHPNIVTVLEEGEERDAHFIAMEYLHGEDVHSIVRVASQRRREIPLEVALHIVLAVCEGLHYAHEMRDDDGEPMELVHRDVSPQNVIVTFDGGVKLLDFGIAKINQRGGETHTGSLKGKVSYMSPEQCLAGRVDRRSDVFALGILLYELCVGKKLFRGRSDFDVMRSVVEGAVPAPCEVRRDLGPGLEAIILRALEKDPARRFSTARELSAALDEVVERLGLKLVPAGLQRFVDELFHEKIEAWKRARARGETLAEHLAALDDATWSKPEAADEGRPEDDDGDEDDRSRSATPVPEHIEEDDASEADTPVPGEPPSLQEIRGNLRALGPGRGHEGEPRPLADLFGLDEPDAKPTVSIRAVEKPVEVASRSIGVPMGEDSVRSLRTALASVKTQERVPAASRPEPRISWPLAAAIIGSSMLLVAIVLSLWIAHVEQMAPLPVEKPRGSSAPIQRAAVTAMPAPAPVADTKPVALPAATSSPAPSALREEPVENEGAAADPATGASDDPSSTQSGSKRSKMGKVRIRTQPECSISINGVPRGHSPTTLYLPPGRYNLSLRNDRWAISVEEMIEVRLDRSVHVRRDLRMQAPSHQRSR